jgi:hypothetical protein
MNKTFPKEQLKEILDSGKDVIETKLTESTRWSLVYRMIFSFEGKFYETTYRVGATESQDERPFEYALDQIECTEVHQVEETIKVWKSL